MTERIWDKYLTERDKAVFAAGGFGACAGYGKRPALLVIDVNYNFCGHKPEPILESVKQWPTSCGEEAWAGVAVIRKVLERARAKGLPVIYTLPGPMRDDGWDMGSWAWKNVRVDENLAPRKRVANVDGNAIVAEIAPGPTDIQLYKRKPSGFFGTDLVGLLTQLGCDSVLVTGTTTSGCVRATVVDAFSHNYRVAMIEDGCFDRSQASHAITLCDMHAKYADVVPSAEALAYIDSLAPGMFQLPPGAAAPRKLSAAA